MIFGCGIASWNLLCPILIPIFHVLRYYINGVLKNRESFPVFFTLMMFFGELVGGAVFECLSFYINKKSCFKRQKPKAKTKITTIQPKNKRGGWLIYILFFLMTFLDGLNLTLEALLSPFENGDNVNYISMLFMLIFTCLLSNYLISTPFYNHHLYSLVIIVIGFIIGVIQLFSAVSEVAYFIAYCCVGLVNAFSVAFFFIAQKYLMEIEMMEPFRIVFYQGVIGSLFSFTFMALMSTPCLSVSDWCKFAFHIENVFQVFNRFFYNWLRSLFILASIVCSGLINVLFIITSKLYTPAHASVCQCFCFIFTNLVFIEMRDHWSKLAYFIIGDIILIIGSVFYFEFVILYWKGFEENTQKEIGRRSLLDKNLFMKDMEEINENSFELAQDSVETFF